MKFKIGDIVTVHNPAAGITFFYSPRIGTILSSWDESYAIEILGYGSSTWSERYVNPIINHNDIMKELCSK